MDMKTIPFILLLTLLFGAKSFAMNQNPEADTLTLKGRVVKADMTNQKGAKLEGVQDYYFSTSDGTGSYFIKTAVGDYSKDDLDKFGNTELTIRCVKKFGNIDIGPEDPSYAATRIGEYIVILEIIEQ